MIEDGELAGNNGPPLLAMKARFPNRDVLFQQIWDPTEDDPYHLCLRLENTELLLKTKLTK